MRKLILGLALATAASALTPALAQKNDGREDYNSYYDRDGNYNGPSWRGPDGRMYCRHRDGTTGLVVGAAAGALVGRSIDRHGNRATGTIVGAAAGALVGRAIERSTNRCQ
jgi:hypothetical protein